MITMGAVETIIVHDDEVAQLVEEFEVDTIEVQCESKSKTIADLEITFKKNAEAFRLNPFAARLSQILGLDISVIDRRSVTVGTVRITAAP